ncbi:MAG: serine hydrolase [bacterium]|nr:serine hydrolase [bacterium]
MAVKERVRYVAILFAILLALPLVNISRFAFFENSKYVNDPNNRYTYEETALRGRIVDRNFRPLAFVSSGERRYPLSVAIGPLLGYANPMYGDSGLEAAVRDNIKGFSVPRTPWEAMLLLDKRDRCGDDMVLTIDSIWQTRAYEALAGYRGAAVVLDVRTGEILAMASRPSYDPNYAQLRRDWDSLIKDSNAPLVERAGQGMYPPGSVFKPLIMAACLEEGKARIDETFYCQRKIDVGNFVLNCNGEHGKVTLEEALAYSCNSAFAELGMRLGLDGIRSWMKKFKLDRPMPYVPGSVKAQLPQGSSPSAPAEAAIGQADILVSPLNMARLVSTLARGGVDMEPRLLRSQVREGEKIVWQCPKAEASRVISQANAQLVNKAMEEVVLRGTGTASQIPGMTLAGKTGSAENPHGSTHAWFIGFTPVQEPRYAVVVILENAGGGGRYAAPVAKNILKLAGELQ